MIKRQLWGSVFKSFPIHQLTGKTHKSTCWIEKHQSLQSPTTCTPPRYTPSLVSYKTSFFYNAPKLYDRNVRCTTKWAPHYTPESASTTEPQYTINWALCHYWLHLVYSSGCSKSDKPACTLLGSLYFGESCTECFWTSRPTPQSVLPNCLISAPTACCFAMISQLCRCRIRIVW